MTPEMDAALEAGRAAARLIREAEERGPSEVHLKGGINLVTEVDRACEDAIREILARLTPGVPVLGEEGGGGAASGPMWVVDPLDGTTNFVHGFPYCAVSIALQDGDRSDVALVVDVFRDVEFAAVRGRGAWRGDRRMRVSETDDLGKALAGTGFPYDTHGKSGEYLRYVEAILNRTRGIRRAGAAALDLAMLARGALDVFWEFHLARWDVAAGILLITEAGGTVTALDGGPLDLSDPCPLATNGRLHEVTLATLAEAARAC